MSTNLDLEIETIFDRSSDHPHSFLYSGSIRAMLLKLLPPNFSENESIHGLLPVFKSMEWGGDPRQLSIFLLCRHRVNASKFFFEMISRWLLPGKRPYISSFFSTDFKLPGLSSDVFTLSEMVITIDHPYELEIARLQLPILESEIYFGLQSIYHANRILEVKGLSSDEKTSLIQERISSLLERRPHDFDYDIFSQMQHFLVMSGEEFKAVRESAHMSRIIYVFYLFRRALRAKDNKGHRYTYVKFCNARLHLPFQEKSVLSVFIGLTFLNENEVFEQRHLERVLNCHFPHLSMIDNSYFYRGFKEERVQLLYFEVEKEGGFSLTEKGELKLKLAEEVKNGVERLIHPVFMPRNEEEVMRNIITLSNQLKSPKDLPQVILSFDEQTDSDLSYTVIFLRVLHAAESSIHEIFEKTESFLKFFPDRVKQMGLMRRKYMREATVFRVKLSALNFLRPDHSVDLFKARQQVVTELQRILGEFRDYNGGMIAKQHEQFLSLHHLLPNLEAGDELLLENFFHSIYPIELRSVFRPELLKEHFLLLKEGVEKNRDVEVGDFTLMKNEDSHLYFLLSTDDFSLKEDIFSRIEKLQLPSSQLLTLSMQVFEIYYLGYIYREEDEERQKIFIKALNGSEP